MTANIVILQLAILGVVLESDLGRRKIGWFRVLRPIIAVVLIVPFFFKTLPTQGNDLILQGSGALVGALLGLFSVSALLVAVHYDPAWHGRFHRQAHGPGKPAVVSQAGLGYATIWIVVTLARLAFAYGSQHWFPNQLGQFLLSHQLNAAALTNAFIFLSVGMDLFRSILLWIRGHRARLTATVRATAPAY